MAEAKKFEPHMMPFTKLLGLELVSAEKDRLVGELTVREDLCTTGGIMHGGAIMTIADSLAAIAAFMNLPEGHKATTTIESKTNFLRAAPLNSRVIAETIPMHVGRRTSVWQTTLRNEAGKTIAIVSQSQMVL
jgi:uncharacterized protein (TIGR00369 family)